MQSREIGMCDRGDRGLAPRGSDRTCRDGDRGLAPRGSDRTCRKGDRRLARGVPIFCGTALPTARAGRWDCPARMHLPNAESVTRP